MVEQKRDYIAEGQASYQRWRDRLLADPESRRLYEEEAAKGELWLQLVETRQAAGVTQAELGRVCKAALILILPPAGGSAI